jgi:D-alanine-D-alanine ligase
LDPAKYLVTCYDPAALRRGCPDDRPDWVLPLRLDEFSDVDHCPDVVFPALHGWGGEDGRIQGMLDLLGVPYVGSGVLASALAMDKSRAKAFLGAHGVPVASEVLVRAGERPASHELAMRVERAFGFPVIVKPNSGGSTIGCTVVRSEGDLENAVSAALCEDSVAVIEPLLSGVEITAGVLGNQHPSALPLIEIEAVSGFYDYEAKYAAGGSRHILPARISPQATSTAQELAVQCHTLLGCRGMSRTDMFVNGSRVTVLETNTLPGMTPTSLLPEAAAHEGIAFPELLDRLIDMALAD